LIPGCYGRPEFGRGRPDGRSRCSTPSNINLGAGLVQTVDRMALQLFVRPLGAWTEKLFTSDL
jgi:hypothetical protein